jgi:hypothetical protein
MSDRHQIPLRLDPETAQTAAAVARVQGVSMNAMIGDALEREIARVTADPEFMAKARQILERDEAIINMLSVQ